MRYEVTGERDANSLREFHVKRWLLWPALALAAIAVAAVPGEDDAGHAAAQAPHPPAAALQTPPQPLVRLDHPPRESIAAKSPDIFAARSWYVPPPPPPPVKRLPPPPPQAPPLPFTYLGQYRDLPGETVVFLVKGDRLYHVSEGDVIDGTYRVDAVAAGQLRLTYLPLNIQQSIAIGETS